jgi:hypothetical protein
VPGIATSLHRRTLARRNSRTGWGTLAERGQTPRSYGKFGRGNGSDGSQYLRIAASQTAYPQMIMRSWTSSESFASRVGISASSSVRACGHSALRALVQRLD